MSNMSPTSDDVDKDTLREEEKCSRKSYRKIDTISKLKGIAMDNGQLEAHISLEYGVRLQSASHIYKRKENTLNKRAQKYNLHKEVYVVDLDQKLLEWMHLQAINGKGVREEQLHKKTQEIISTLGKEFNCIDNWLLDFCKRHKIVKHTSVINCSAQIKQEWKNTICGLDVDSLYIGGVCALSHTVDFDSYIKSQETDNYLSLIYIVNGLGSDKRELAVVGKEILGSEFCLRSLPVSYYHCENPQVNYTIIVDYLNKWDIDLSSEGRSILLVLNIPEKIKEKMHFKNIKLLSILQMKYITKVLDKIVDSFKYHYRRLQINKTAKGDECTLTFFLDYLHMISIAWCTIPSEFISRLTFPPEDGSLFIYGDYESSCDQTLSQWCKALNLESDSNLLDKYMFFDKKFPCLNYGQLDDFPTHVNKVLLENNCKSTSAIEAYQAMKRLVSYLQSRNAKALVLKYAKHLENHLEYEVLSLMHHLISRK